LGTIERYNLFAQKEVIRSTGYTAQSFPNAVSEQIKTMIGLHRRRAKGGVGIPEGLRANDLFLSDQAPRNIGTAIETTKIFQPPNGNSMETTQR
jgi:hypothetical protein